METKPSYYAVIPANVRYDKDLPSNAKLLYGEITALCNAEGFCWASNAYFADLYGMSTRNVSRLISQLNDKGYVRVEIINDYERKIYINATHDKIVQPHDKIVQPPTTKLSKGYDEIVQPPHDKIVYKNNTSINTTNNNTINNKNNIKEKSISPKKLEEEFEQLWKIYPRKIGKKKAFDSFKKARKTKKIPYETIENGLYRYITYLEQQETEEQFVMHASTWFNQEKWQDDYICTGINKKPKNAMEYFRMKYENGDDYHEPTRNGEIINDHPELLSELF